MQSSSLVVIFKFFKDGLSKKLVKGFGSLLCPLASSTSSNTLVEGLKKRRGHSTDPFSGCLDVTTSCFVCFIMFILHWIVATA